NKNKPVNQETDKTEEDDLTPSGITGLLTNDFFLVKQDEKGKWLPPIRIDDTANTKFDEGTPSFSADGNKMYYTYCSKDETGSRTAEIYVSSRSSASWSKGSRVPIVKDSVTALAHPSISPDGKWLYFVSNAIGGYGGKDLFRCKVSGNSYGPMENLGTDINTPGDEVFPYAKDSVTLYFASNGHPGMGGLDLYKATQVSPDHWKVENLKAPINSNSDDFGITFEGKKEKGFFTSNRRDAKGYDHLYSFELPVITIRIEGIVDDVDEEPIAGATVWVVGRDGLNAKAHTLRDGDYGLELERNINYVMMASAKGFLNQNFELTTAPEEKSETYFVDFYLSPINRPVVIDHIYYDFDKATLRPESKEALDKMVKTLQDNPSITIELRAHTDRKGSDAYNIRLAQRRAQSVVDYLIKSGISKDRLEAKGYGKRMPKVCTKKLAKTYDFLKEKDVLTEEFILKLTPEQQEIADQLNRRTEFKVIRTNYNLF
ncbi:MAG: OmpA family protein, partial [Massilibacteroides sp.]|nr:OmpA family protein [Massilibacteroides sp.]